MNKTSPRIFVVAAVGLYLTVFVVAAVGLYLTVLVSCNV
jgi:hypothetical protein